MKHNKTRHKKQLRHLVATALMVAVALLATVLASEVNAASVTTGAQRFILDNGFTVILKKDTSAPVAALQVWVKTGSADETEEEAGITHLIEHMIFKGTPTKKTGEIAGAIEGSGGNINAYTSLDRTVYLVEIASSQFETGLDVLLDAVQHSLFDTVELEREKEVVLEEYRRSLDMPRRRLSWALMDLAYKKHPYKRPIIGYESTIRSFDRKAILNYMDKWYAPDNMVLVAVGDFDTNRALKTIKELVKDFPQRAGQKPSRTQEPEQTALRRIVKKDRVQQVYLDMSWHIPALTHQDIYPLDLLETILSHGKSSRLYGRLKMEANLVYGVSAGVYGLADPGLFSIDASLGPENLDKALKAIAEVLIQVSREPVTASELEKAKTIAEADFIFDMETMAGQASTLAFFQTMTGDMYNADDYLEGLKQVTPKDISRVARTYLTPENLSIGIMAPAASDIEISSKEIAALFTTPASTPLPEDDQSRRGVKEASMTTLSNGMRLIIKENTRVPEVSFTGAFLGGTRFERPTEWGISNFVAKMLTRGTTERTISQIASTVESRAGTLGGFSGRNTLGVSGKFLSKDIYPGLELLADVILHPSFPEPEIEKARVDILAAIKAKKDRPVAQLFDLFYETLFQDSPYGHPPTGTEQSIRSMKRAELVKWYKMIAIPSNFVLVIVGDVSEEDLIPYVKTLFGGFAASSHKLPYVPPEPPLKGPRVAHKERPTAQTHLTVGYLGADLESRENASMALVKTALAGQGGRLFSRLRDKESLAYAITAFRRPGLDTGAFGVYLACDPTKLPIAKKAVFRELDEVRRDGLTKDELETAKRYLLGNLRIGLQTNGNQASQMTLDELYGLGYDDLHRFIERIEAVTLEDIREATRKIIVPDGFVLVTVGPKQNPSSTR
ncbi:MAG: insulinase family protein [Desulfobacteraceae bacterium]|nr:insulinase family protein [Desulfobacteraceae bacterium]